MMPYLFRAYWFCLIFLTCFSNHEIMIFIETYKYLFKRIEIQKNTLFLDKMSSNNERLVDNPLFE